MNWIIIRSGVLISWKWYQFIEWKWTKQNPTRDSRVVTHSLDGMMGKGGSFGETVKKHNRPHPKFFLLIFIRIHCFYRCYTKIQTNHSYRFFLQYFLGSINDGNKCTLSDSFKNTHPSDDEARHCQLVLDSMPKVNSEFKMTVSWALY